MYTQTIIGGLITSAPFLVAWIVAIVIAMMMLGHGGARAERFLLVGASLMLVQSLLAIPTTALIMWLTVDKGMANIEAATVTSIFRLISGGIGLAGIICLIYAFWVRFKGR